MLTHIHPAPLRFACGTRLGLRNPTLAGSMSGVGYGQARQVPRAPYAHRRCYLGWGDLSHHLRGRYPSFIALTGSCARPNPSRRLRSMPWSAGLCRLLSAPAGRWPFPTLSPQVSPQVPEPLPRRSPWCTCSFLPTGHRPSPRCNWVGIPPRPYSDFSTDPHFGAVAIRLPSGPRVCSRPRSLPPQCHALGGHRFYIRASHGLLPPRTADMLAVRTEQLTA
jgi:hypothetical protein